jgi:hypothetical protein
VPYSSIISIFLGTVPFVSCFSIGIIVAALAKQIVSAI